MNHTEKTPCALCELGTMYLVDTGHGITNGDKWSCETCKGFVVARAGCAPDCYAFNKGISRAQQESRERRKMGTMPKVPR